MSQHKQILGLDIGAHSAKAVRAVRSGGSANVVETGWVRLPADAEERRRVLESFLEQKGWSRLPCVVAIQGESVVLRPMAIDPSGRRPTSQIVSDEMEQFSELGKTGAVHDYVQQRRVAGQRRLLLAVGRLDGVLRAIEVAAECGLRVVDVVPASVAQFNAVQMLCTRLSRPFVTINFGHDSTHLLVGQRKSLLFARRIPLGASSLQQPDATAARRALEKWLLEVRSCISLYKADHADDRQTPQRIILFGGGAFVAGIAEAVEESTGIKTSNLGERTRVRSIEEIERFPTAIGLALGGLNAGAAPISLLPAPMKEELVLRWQKKYWYLAAAALVLALGIATLQAYTGLQREKVRIRQARAELAELRDLRERLDRQRALTAGLRQQIAPFRRAIHGARILQAVLQAVADAKHEDDWMTLVADAKSYAGEGMTEASLTPPPKRVRRDGIDNGEETTHPHLFTEIVIEGYTPVLDLSTVRAMIDALRNSPGIVDADLLGDDRVREDPERDERWAGTGCRLFAVEIAVPLP